MQSWKDSGTIGYHRPGLALATLDKGEDITLDKEVLSGDKNI